MQYNVYKKRKKAQKIETLKVIAAVIVFYAMVWFTGLQLII